QNDVHITAKSRNSCRITFKKAILGYFSFLNPFKRSQGSMMECNLRALQYIAFDTSCLFNVTSKEKLSHLTDPFVRNRKGCKMTALRHFGEACHICDPLCP